MPVRHQECLGFEEVGVGASEDLGGAPVKLVDGWIGWWETWVGLDFGSLNVDASTIEGIFEKYGWNSAHLLH